MGLYLIKGGIKMNEKFKKEKEGESQ